MAYLTDVIVELSDAVHLIGIRSGNTKLATGMIASICTKIGTIQQWGAGPAHTLCKQIASSELSADMEDQLNAAVG